jgi:hypothetical protein
LIVSLDGDLVLPRSFRRQWHDAAPVIGLAWDARAAAQLDARFARYTRVEDLRFTGAAFGVWEYRV